MSKSFNKYFFVLISTIVITTNLFAQTSEYIKRVVATYGYLKGQEYSLNIIKKKFPDIQVDVIKTEIAFNAKFDKAHKGIKKYLLDTLGQTEFEKFNTTLSGQLKTTLLNQNFTKKIAIDFIEEVKQRANGNIPTPFFETLLSFQYADNPQDEFLDGFKNIFKTKNHPKAKNTDWQLEIPKSWKAEEAIRPNIIQKFASDYGTGLESIMIINSNLGYTPSKKEIEELLSENEIKNSLSNNCNFISFKKINIDNYPGIMTEYETTSERIGTTIKIRILNFSFIKNDKLYILQCQISDMLNADLSSKMQKYAPLFRLVANSIVENTQYEY